jgi:hypothetical protein
VVGHEFSAFGPRNLVVFGANEHHLPAAYIESLVNIVSIDDPDPARVFRFLRRSRIWSANPTPAGLAAEHVRSEPEVRGMAFRHQRTFLLEHEPNIYIATAVDMQWRK